MQGSKIAQQNLDEEDTQKILPRPDFSQMIPFKPKTNAYPGEHPLGGGTFPQPPALAALCAVLPPPVCFRGPFVSIDKLVDVFNRIKIDGEEQNVSLIANLFNFILLQPQFRFLARTVWTRSSLILQNPFIGLLMRASIQMKV